MASLWIKMRVAGRDQVRSQKPSAMKMHVAGRDQVRSQKPSAMKMHVAGSVLSTDSVRRHKYALNLKFSWREPRKYSIFNRSNRSWKGDTPLPKPLDQKKSETCIPCSIKGMMEAQMGLMANNTNQEVPRISLAQLEDVFSKLKKKTLEKMLLWLEKVGVVAEDDYIKKKGKKTARVRPGARRYKIKYNEGYDPERNSFFEDVSEALLRGEILIGEFLVKDDYDYSGENTLYKGEGEVLDREHEGEAEEGHAVLLTGYGAAIEDDNIYSIFEYMNSYGGYWGRNEGFAEINYKAMHFVYNTQVLKWF